MTQLTQEMEAFRDFLEKEGFLVHLFEQDGFQNAEVEKWTDGGVDMIFVLMPFSKDEFLIRVKDFDPDEEVELHWQDKAYKENFTLRQSLNDFEAFQKMLNETVKKLNRHERKSLQEKQPRTKK